MLVAPTRSAPGAATAAQRVRVTERAAQTNGPAGFPCLDIWAHRLRGMRHARQCVMSITFDRVPTGRHVSSRADTALLAGGLLYPVLCVVFNDVVAATLYPGYSRTAQAISELSATAAPSRPVLVATVPFFTVLVMAFGLGVWRVAAGNRALRVTGAILMAHGATFPVWLFAPMTSREQMGSAMPANDVAHIVLSAFAVLLILLQVGAGAVALGKRFRVFSIVSGITIVVFGALTGIEAPNVARGDTPWMGLYERISYDAWLTWMAVLAVALLRRTRGAPS